MATLRRHPPPTISFPKSVARIIKLVEERRERGDEDEDEGEEGKRGTDFFPCRPPLSDERDFTPFPHPVTYMLYLDLSRCIPWSSFVSTLFVPILLPPSRPLLPPGSLVSLSSLPRYFFISTWERRVFVKEPIFSFRGEERVSRFDRELRGIRKSVLH